MKNVVISMQNTLLSESIARVLSETGDFRVERILQGRVGDTETVCRANHADVLLMEVSRMQPFTLTERLELATQVRDHGLRCKVALLCDENADADLAYRVKNARQDRLLDGFFYASVTPAYLAAAIDAL